MLRSMTGFGTAQADIEGIEYAVEIRSVNNRYFKAVIRLPEIWSGAETEIEKLIRNSVSRGSVTAGVRMRVPDEKAAYRVNTVALESYINQLKVLKVNADHTLRIDLGTMLQLPGVCEPPPREEICKVTHDGLMDVIRKAMGELITMRLSEGEAIKDDLLVQCDAIDTNLASISQRSGDVVKDYHVRLETRVQELVDTARVNIDADTLAREVAIYADRCDIAEELSRLAGHLVQFRQTMDSDELVGRKLDFIAQEMLREANTIASKANDAKIGRAVVEIKTAVDRIKEQAANVE